MNFAVVKSPRGQLVKEPGGRKQLHGTAFWSSPLSTVAQLFSNSSQLPLLVHSLEMGVLTHPTLTCDPETGPTEGAVVDLGHPLGLSSALTGFFCAWGLPAASLASAGHPVLSCQAGIGLLSANPILRFSFQTKSINKLITCTSDSFSALHWAFQLTSIA